MFAPRPEILSAPPTIAYGYREFLICAGPDARQIRSVCLIRPAAVTHGVDQNQLFVPLQIMRQCEATLKVVTPGGPDAAPPGLTCCSS